MARQPAYKRILLKLSGEALMGEADYGISPTVMERVAGEVRDVAQAGVEVALVVGGGNIFRGEGLARSGMDRVTGDHMGMLATVINSLALQDAIERLGLTVRVMSAIRINEVCEDYIRRRAVRHLEKGRVVIFASVRGTRSSPPTRRPRCARSRSAPACCSRQPRWTVSTTLTR
jgi:uridylate kinase